MDAGALARAPYTGDIEPRLVRRLSVFVAASLALHALSLTLYTAAGSGPRSYEAGEARALHAVLAAAPSDSAVVPPAEPGAGATRSEADRPSSGAVSTAAPGATSGGAGPDIPLPEKWYTASELGALAQPLVAPMLRYPQELAGSGMAARVRLKLFVDEHGMVRKAEMVRRGPDPTFDVAAVSAWEGVRFSPAIKNGVPVKSQKLLELDFEP